MQTTQSINEMKCIIEKMTCNKQDTNLSWYVPIRGQGTSTLDHWATTPRAINYIVIFQHFRWLCISTYLKPCYFLCNYIFN